MGSLKLYGMRSAYDEVMAAGIKRQHEPPRIVGDLLQSEIAEKQARSIRYQMTVAKLPLAKDIEEFDFTGTPINEGLVRELANGSFVADQRNVVLIGGTGTGKTHLAIAIARALIRSGTRGRFYNVVDLVNRLETETRGGKQGRLADYMTRLDFVILDELGQPKGWEGAIAVAEDEHAGWFVSPEYRTFVCRDGSLLPAYLRQLVGTNWFQSELAKLTRGQGARRERLRPDMLLDMPIRMPSLAAQRKTLAIHEKIQRLRAHTAPFAYDADALIPALLHEIFNGKAVAA